MICVINCINQLSATVIEIPVFRKKNLRHLHLEVRLLAVNAKYPDPLRSVTIRFCDSSDSPTTPHYCFFFFLSIFILSSLLFSSTSVTSNYHFYCKKSLNLHLYLWTPSLTPTRCLLTKFMEICPACFDVISNTTW